MSLDELIAAFVGEGNNTRNLHVAIVEWLCTYGSPEEDSNGYIEFTVSKGGLGVPDCWSPNAS